MLDNRLYRRYNSESTQKSTSKTKGLKKMKKFAKRAAAFLLAAVLSFSLAGCYNENLTWAAKKGDTELPIGAYIYYLSVAYNEAAAKIDTETEVLKGEVEDTPAAEWITARANAYMNQYFWMQDEMTRLGLSMTDEEYAEASQTTANYWYYFGKSLEKFGIAQTSFDIAYSQYNAMYLKVFEAMYGAGGEREIPEADLLAHFTDTYMNYEYFTAPLTKKAEDGTSEDMTDEEKAEVTAALDKLEQQVSDGTLTVEEAAAEYAESIDADPNYVQSVNNRDGMASSYLPDAFITSLESMKEGDIQIFEASNYMVFLHRLPIDDAVEEKLGAEDDRLTLMLELKSEEYQDYVRDSAAAGVDGVELNQEAIDHYKPSMFESTTKNGTSSTAEESSTSSETSASEESSTPSESSAEE